MNDIALNANSSSIVTNPFGSITSAPYQDGIGKTQAASRELAETQAQIFLAKQFPRDQRRATENVLTACQRPGLASVAVYSFSKGGSDVSGPSIRLAEEIARNWGNLECGWNEMERGDDFSKVRTFAWDKETNVLKTTLFVVPHYRTTRQGKKRLTDEREIYELLANQASRRMRACILALIPGDVVDAAVEQCQKTMITHVDLSPASILSLVKAFSELGVTKERVEKRIQRRIDAITPAQFVRMREIYASIRDGMSDANDWFEEEPAVSTAPASNETEPPKIAVGTNAIKETLKKKKSQKDLLGTTTEQTEAKE